ncbi:LysR family transcriptional regulator [Rouxiella silvae]|uniref:LysR family transcriptional regulator n=1 Tax=Rouxiella silvae TaxID=1646373 RepID=A0ABX3TZ20_9GAMM|nr:LysR family transcriptional regulator [Rouxiella silvae]KQN46947.1 LysR family transcriptional regulator [Serratia sp. Leaf50]ORJ20484.1 LysR family transcriptional regulator [Rouxiella silvae]
MQRIDFADLQVFLTVLRCRSFKLAAIELGLSSSAVSHAVRRLETRLGARLLNRTSRAVSSTALGMDLAERLAGGFDAISSALETINAPGRGRFGELRINVFADAAHLLITPALQAFSERCADVKLTIVIEDRPVDITAEGFDAGVRYGHLVPEDMIAVPLSGDQQWIIAASPDYLERRGTPYTLSDLAQHNCLQLLLGNNASFRWEFGKAENTVTMNVPGLISIKDTATTISAARAGLGLGYFLESRIEEELTQGTLVKVLGDFAAYGAPFHMYYSSRRHGHPALRELVNIIRQQNGLQSLPEL